MCLSLELDFEKFVQTNYRMQVMKIPRPHADLPCRYRRPHHGELWCCWSPLLGAARKNPNILQRRCYGNSFQTRASLDCLDNLLRLKAPAHGGALGHDEVADDGSGTRSSRATTSDGSATLATQLARGMVAAASRARSVARGCAAWS